MVRGISVIICCYNSASRIVNTLEGIFRQEFKTYFPWEIVLVNNNSSDNTTEVALKKWEDNKTKVSFNIINEPTPGLIHARKAGVKKSKYEYIIFVDDDNYLDSNYLETVYEILSTKPDVGICNGDSTARFDQNTVEPVWFNLCKIGYAVGKQGDQEGYVEKIGGNFWGAGFSFRRIILDEVFNQGFDTLLTGRKGESLSSGEDIEMCYWAKGLGYGLWYTPKLHLYHYITNQRLSEEYLYRLFKAMGKTIPVINFYRYYFHGAIMRKSWFISILREGVRVLRHDFFFLFSFFYLTKANYTFHVAQRYKFLEGFKEIVKGGPKLFNEQSRRINILLDTLDKTRKINKKNV